MLLASQVDNVSRDKSGFGSSPLLDREAFAAVVSVKLQRELLCLLIYFAFKVDRVFERRTTRSSFHVGSAGAVYKGNNRTSNQPHFCGTSNKGAKSNALRKKKKHNNVPVVESHERNFLPWVDERVRERDPIDYASTVDKNRPYFDLLDSLEVKEMAKPFGDQLYSALEYMRSGAFDRTDKPVEYFMRQSKYFKLKLFDVFEKLPNWQSILQYISKVFGDSTSGVTKGDTTELLNNSKKRDRKRRAVNFNLEQDDKNRNSNKIYWLVRNIVNLLIAAGVFPSTVFPTSGNGKQDSMTILINLPGCLPQMFHYDYDTDLWKVKRSTSATKCDIDKYLGRSMMFNFSMHQTQSLDLFDEFNPNAPRPKIMIPPMTLLVFDGDLKHAGPSNTSSGAEKVTYIKLFMYADVCPGMRNTHKYAVKRADGNWQFECDNAIHPSDGEFSDAEEGADIDDYEDLGIVRCLPCICVNGQRNFECIH